MFNLKDIQKEIEELWKKEKINENLLNRIKGEKCLK